MWKESMMCSRMVLGSVYCESLRGVNFGYFVFVSLV